ncbi:Reverse transcriptase (RNA-dependent DNA polymerase) [Popillia japonica]|uniref:Reverse transcriptase (RNA-dependent DNA polymerase) n=1 Tax=Popillia japonica TaxID=7064 RepID=A0AAW1HGR7_POPJA
MSNCISAITAVSSGVPQGSHLGPILFKLGNFGVHGRLLHLITDYLTERTQYVVMSNCISAITAVSSGVPQGSHLGPILFTVYCDKNKLRLNTNKCHHIAFSQQTTPPSADLFVDGELLGEADSVVDLGVVMDSGLSFRNHVEYITRRAWRNLGFLLRVTKDFRHHSSIIMLYKSIVRPLLEYAATVWNPLYTL